MPGFGWMGRLFGRGALGSPGGGSFVGPPPGPGGAGSPMGLLLALTYAA